MNGLVKEHADVSYSPYGTIRLSDFADCQMHSSNGSNRFNRRRILTV